MKREARDFSTLNRHKNTAGGRESRKNVVHPNFCFYAKLEIFCPTMKSTCRPLNIKVVSPKHRNCVAPTSKLCHPNIEVVSPQHQNCVAPTSKLCRPNISCVAPTSQLCRPIEEALPGGCPRSLVGILKCLVSAFCQGHTRLSEI